LGLFNPALGKPGLPNLGDFIEGKPSDLAGGRGPGATKSIFFISKSGARPGIPFRKDNNK
jgi:hypothetical protein